MFKVLGTLREDANVPKRGTPLFHSFRELVLDNPASCHIMFIHNAFHKEMYYNTLLNITATKSRTL